MASSAQAASVFPSPLGPIEITADEQGVTGLRFVQSSPCPDSAGPYENSADARTDGGADPVIERILSMTEDWLSTYFSGSDPGFLPPLHPSGTDFQLLVWKELFTIAYGTTTTYGHLADRIASSNGHRASARAVGRAIGSNRILLLIPCHRVIGADGSLTGYAGGVKRKASLLALEKAGTGTSKKAQQRHQKV